jgi:hypothetical protein
MKHHYKAIYKDITARNQLHTVKFDRKEDVSIWFCMSQSDFASSKFSSCSPNKKITNQENIVNLILHQNNLQTLSTNIKLPLIKVTGINTFNKTLSGLTRLVLQPMLNIYLTFNFLSILPPVSFKLELETRTVCSQHHILLYPYKKIQKLSVSPVIRITQQNYIHLWLSDIITYGGNHVMSESNEVLLCGFFSHLYIIVA